MHSTQAAAALAACSFLSVFPQAQLTEIRAEPFGFTIDFVLREKLDEYSLEPLSHHLEHFLSEKPDLYPMTMMRENAAELVKSQKQRLLAETLRHHPQTLVEMVKIGEKVVPGTPGECGYVKLLEIKNGRLTGASFASKDELKGFMKRWNERARHDSWTLAQEKGLIQVVGGQVIWLEKGIVAATKILDRVGQFWAAQGYQRVSLPPFASPAEAAAWLKKNPGLPAKGYCLPSIKGFAAGPDGLLGAPLDCDIAWPAPLTMSALGAEKDYLGRSWPMVQSGLGWASLMHSPARALALALENSHTNPVE